MRARSEPFLAHRCRHERHEGTKLTCAAGLDPAKVRVRLTPEQHRAFGYGLPIGAPCSLGTRHGLICPGYAPWTEEEIAADKQRTTDMLTAVSKQQCLCGAPLRWSGSFFSCSLPCAAPLSGHACRHADGDQP